MRTVWERWKAFAEKTGNFQVTLVFSFLYFFLVTPLGLISSKFRDFINTKGRPKWKEITDNTQTLKKLKLQ